METVTTFLLMIQLWTDPPPKIQIIYQKEFQTREECFKAKEQWEKTKLVSLCLIKTKNK